MNIRNTLRSFTRQNLGFFVGQLATRSIIDVSTLEGAIAAIFVGVGAANINDYYWHCRGQELDPLSMRGLIDWALNNSAATQLLGSSLFTIGGLVTGNDVSYINAVSAVSLAFSIAGYSLVSYLDENDRAIRHAQGISNA